MKKLATLWAISMLFFAFQQKEHVSTQPAVSEAEARSILTFPLPVSVSTYVESIPESRYVSSSYPNHLAANSPKIPISLRDHGGFVGLSSFCGEINAPDLSNINGKPVATGKVKRTVPAVFTASETFDAATDLGSPLSLRYHKRAPIKFNGKIKTVKVDLLYIV
jgi:hypothetical protein